MVKDLLRLLVELAPAAEWVVGVVVVVILALVVYLGTATIATLFSKSPECAKIRYRVFRDLLETIDRRRR